MNITQLRLAYEFLGATPETSDEDLQEKYHEALRKHHPDKGGDPTALIRARESHRIITQARAKANVSNPLVDIFKFSSMLIGHRIQKEYTVTVPLTILRRGGVLTREFQRMITCPCIDPSKCSRCDGCGYFTELIPCKVHIPHGFAPPRQITVIPLNTKINLGYEPTVKLKYDIKNLVGLDLVFQPSLKNFLVKVTHEITLLEAAFSRQFIVQGLEEQIVIRIKTSLLSLGTTLVFSGKGLGALESQIGEMVVLFKIIDPPSKIPVCLVNPSLTEVVPPGLKVLTATISNTKLPTLSEVPKNS